MMAKTIYIATQSGPMSLRQLAASAGVNYMTLYSRFVRGDRTPDRLTRAADERFRGGDSDFNWRLSHKGRC